jgi:hypothetical protein
MKAVCDQAIDKFSQFSEISDGDLNVDYVFRGQTGYGRRPDVVDPECFGR